jgi:hypothetical protein
MDWERVLKRAKRVGADVNYYGKPPLERALEEGNVRAVTELLRMGATLLEEGLIKLLLGLRANDESFELMQALAERLDGKEDGYETLILEMARLSPGFEALEGSDTFNRPGRSQEGKS